MLDHSPGIKDQLDEIMERLDLVAFDVRFIVIHGMGGIGKTTLAKAVFRQISPYFKKLLSDVLKLSCTNLSFIDEGAHLIKTRLHGKKILIVLDDVDNRDQIMRLAGEPNWYGGGSRIIITTRNIEFLVKEGEDGNVPMSNTPHFSFYTMPEMNWDDARQLFCERALGCAKPPPDYMDISEKVINALGRLPLALDVVGSTLHGKCKSTWENVLYKLKKVMNEDVKKKLMISYEALDPNQQQIYLDIACFFINQEKTTAIKYWDAVFGYPTEIEVKILTRMSLIKIIDYDKLWMHDQLRDLGRDIVRPESCNIRLRGSRLWLPKDAFHLGTENIVALNLGTPEPDATYRFTHTEFARLVNLRFLQLDHGNFQGDFKDHFSKLRWLSWSNCPSEFLATNFGLENLAVLELSGNNITKDRGGWHQIMVAKRLKVLKLLDCPLLRKTPKFLAISSLERLILRCNQLGKIDKSIGFLQHLDYLEIFSQELSVLPHLIGNLVNVKHLILSCWELQKLPDSIGQLESLLELDVKHTSVRELPYSIGNLGKLKIFMIPNGYLKKLPNSFGRLQSLVKLDLSLSRIKSLPNCIGNLKKLKVLNLGHSRIIELPKTIGMLENLEELSASCEHLEGEIPSEIGALSSLKILDLSGGHFSGLPTTINQLTNLQKLNLWGCRSIQQLPKLPKSLRSLSFSLDSLTTIPDFSNLTNLVHLDIIGTTLQQLSVSYADPRSLTKLPSSLQELILVDVQSSIDWSLFSNLENLSRLIIERYSLGEICFDGFGRLRNFNELVMFDFPLLKMLPILPCLKEIQHLYLCQFPHLIEIQGLGELKSLRTLRIWNCNSIKSLNESDMSNLQNLKRLDFNQCESLESVLGVPKSCELTVCYYPRFNKDG
ncbi:LOW QUALITY PROTEIN: hypothetical protein BT93_L3111 [Corymbia citriodora subsp. variegata]|uniref:AAA+ ATPase domain-containing protein n=1 Tax=Corymbia citriodora subsp. variegata TaxID=360336 RepID=A0A8T0CMD2_CORYI|nr:LOW QUALITY PROTEIN: hypothetical protein BT93_L3111 [Corymbia citriodora subsp. variegata]